MLSDLQEVYYPESLGDAVARLLEYGEGAAPIAGGTDLVSAPPPGIRCLVDITRLGLAYIEEEEGQVRLGATTTMQSLATSPVVASLAGGILNMSTCQGWPKPVRNAATLGGNLANAGPFNDTPPALLALDAEVVVVDAEGEKRIPIDEFFVDYRITAHGRGLVKEVVIPRPTARTCGTFMKLGRSEVDVALVNVGAVVQMEGGTCRKARLAVGAVTRTPRRLPEAEALLESRPLTPETLETVAEAVMECVDPILDYRASADYRREMSGVLVVRALKMLMSAPGAA